MNQKDKASTNRLVGAILLPGSPPTATENYVIFRYETLSSFTSATATICRNACAAARGTSCSTVRSQIYFASYQI